MTCQKSVEEEIEISYHVRVEMKNGLCEGLAIFMYDKIDRKLATFLRQDPLIWVFGDFDFFAPWYRRSGEASSVKIS